MGPMLRRAAVFVAAFSVLTPSAALACGVLLSGDGRAELREFQALLSFDGQMQHLLVAIGYEDPDPGEGLAWVMPFPSAPEVGYGSDAGLEAAFEITAPPLRSEHVPSVIPLLCACGSSEDTTAGSGVSLLDRTQVGDLELSTLQATDVDDVAEWMDDNGYEFHDRQSASIQSYLDRDWVLVAARVAPGVEASSASLTPVLFSFATDEASYPLAMASSDHAEEPLRMSLLTVTPERPEVEGYDTATVEPDDEGYFPQPEGLELRYSAELSAGEAEDVSDSVPADRGQWLSRFEASLDPASLSGDLILAAADSQQPLQYDEWIRGYRDDVWIARGGQVLLTFVLVTPLVLLVAGLVVLIGGLFRGGFRRS
jgi:hypothetical protein